MSENGMLSSFLLFLSQICLFWFRLLRIRLYWFMKSLFWASFQEWILKRFCLVGVVTLRLLDFHIQTSLEALCKSNGCISTPSKNFPKLPVTCKMVEILKIYLTMTLCWVFKHPFCYTLLLNLSINIFRFVRSFYHNNSFKCSKFSFRLLLFVRVSSYKAYLKHSGFFWSSTFDQVVVIFTRHYFYHHFSPFA